MRARLERAWSGLSRAEQLALGGTLAAALAGGGLLLRSGLKAMARPLSIAEMRPMTTMKLLRSFERGNESQKDAIAKFCFCRVHDLRDFLLDPSEGLVTLARQVLSSIAQLLSVQANQPAESESSVTAQRKFIQSALGPPGVSDAPTQKAATEAAERVMQTSEDFVYSTNRSEESKKIFQALYEKEIQRLLWRKQKIKDRENLLSAITSLAANGDHKEYGYIACWDVREVMSMEQAFKGKSFGNTLGVLDLSFWDTSNVIDMNEMFYGYKGNVEVGMWDTSKVIDMGGMFEEARDFNADIGDWDTGRVENMASMFQKASKFNKDIGKWDTSNVEHTSVMFYEATAFDQSLSAWNLKSIRVHEDMFTRSGMEHDEDKKPADVRLTLGSPTILALFGQPSLRSYV
jgi:surface protein